MPCKFFIPEEQRDKRWPFNCSVVRCFALCKGDRRKCHNQKLRRKADNMMDNNIINVAEFCPQLYQEQ